MLTYTTARQISREIHAHVDHLRKLRDINHEIDALTACSPNFDILHIVREIRMSSHREEFTIWKDTMPLRMVQLQMFKHALLLQAPHLAVLPADDPRKIDFDQEVRKCEHIENTLLGEDLRDLHTLFRFYNMDDTECRVICEWLSVCSLFGFKQITMESFENCVQDLRMAQGSSAVLRAKMQACILGFEKSDYNAKKFCQQHSGIKMGYKSANFDQSEYLNLITS